MRSTELDAEQLAALERVLREQLAWYYATCRRIKATNMPGNDPLAQSFFAATHAIQQVQQTIERLRAGLPQPYRPLVASYKTHGLRAVDQPWAQRQREAAEAIQRHAENAERLRREREG